ncbi:MAG: glycosyltransferase family 4 protein [Planctomycetes bacterium]|nr:glycosyltransferase family 4 protein [Planctomycetota bacterium]
MKNPDRIRLALVVSHPIQYYVPLYRRLAQRDDVHIKVFFTWHGGEAPSLDHGFKKEVQWDIPLTGGYEAEVVPNTATTPGTHHFFGLRNPSLVSRVLAWKPNAVHITGYAWLSHLQAMHALHRRGVPVLFRGDSHLLDESRQGLRWWGKRVLLRRVFTWPSAFLYVGQANKAYYEAFGVPPSRLHHCPHSIEVDRFAMPAAELERQAVVWRQELGIPEDRFVLLFAGKFEDKKQPVALMRAVERLANSNVLLVMVGDGELGDEVREIASRDPDRFRVLPFQNQSRMPLVYRLGDVFVLPSAYGETWGLAVNEAMACGRPVLISDRVGCAADVVRPLQNGAVFRANDWSHFNVRLAELLSIDWHGRIADIRRRASLFSTEATEHGLMTALRSMHR